MQREKLLLSLPALAMNGNMIIRVFIILNLQWQTTEKQRSLKELSCCGFIVDFFDKQHVQDSFGVLMKPRPGYRRCFLIILLISMALYTFQRDENQYLFLYATFKFNWGVDVYSVFKTFKSSAYVIAMLIAVPLMNKFFNWRDTVRSYAHLLLLFFDFHFNSLIFRR